MAIGCCCGTLIASEVGEDASTHYRRDWVGRFQGPFGWHGCTKAHADPTTSTNLSRVYASFVYFVALYPPFEYICVIHNSAR